MAPDVSAFAAVQHARQHGADEAARWTVSVHGGGCGLTFVESGSRADAFAAGHARFRQTFRTEVDPTVEVARVVERAAGAVGLGG